MRDAGRRYQDGRRGRLRHAARQRRWRQRKVEKVTHHGSTLPAGPARLPTPTGSTESARSGGTRRPSQARPSGAMRCHFCGRRCGPWLRRRRGEAGGREARGDDLQGARSRHPAAVPRRTLARRHDRQPTRRASQHGAPRAGPRGPRRAGAIEAALDDRAFRGVHARGARAVPETSCQSPLRDGPRARLPGSPRPLPSPDRPDPTQTSCRGLPEAAHAAGGAGTGGLGALRYGANRPGGALDHGLRDGAELLPPPLRALLPRSTHGQLPPRARRGLRGVRRSGACPSVRQLEERGARAPGRCDPFPPARPVFFRLMLHLDARSGLRHTRRASSESQSG